MLLPLADDSDIDTLTACLHLGLRLRFEGNPAHLVVTPQIMPDPTTGMERYYLMLLDAVPGGTGYLKTLYQETDAGGRPGEGIMQVMRLAKNALETCRCRRLQGAIDARDTDGCYRCIRTYHLQYAAKRISRERGIVLLGQLLEAGERRVPQQELASIRPHSLFDSMLEKRFVDALRHYVEEKHGNWERTIIRGNEGFRFSFPGSERLWELELQPSLGPAQGVALQCQPDFLLRSDDDRVWPVAIFADGFQFHCHPVNRLADDMQKRRAIVASGRYHVWSVTWDDLDPSNREQLMLCHPQVAQMVQQYARAESGRGQRVPDGLATLRNGLAQLKAFLDEPHAPGWAQVASCATFFPLQLLATRRAVRSFELQSALEDWAHGGSFPGIAHTDGAEWIYNDRASLTDDVVTYITLADAIAGRRSQSIVLARLADGAGDCAGENFCQRWRRFLAGMNLYQFLDSFRFWTAAEAQSGTAPEIPLRAAGELSAEWQAVLEAAAAAVRTYIHELAAEQVSAIPRVEYFNDQIGDDAFAELAWPDCRPPVAVLAGDQESFASQWQRLGWRVFTPDELQARGIRDLIDQLASSVQGA